MGAYYLSLSEGVYLVLWVVAPRELGRHRLSGRTQLIEDLSVVLADIVVSIDHLLDEAVMFSCLDAANLLQALDLHQLALP